MTLHPEFAALIAGLPPADWMGDVTAARAELARAGAATRPPVDKRVSVADRVITGPDGDPLAVRVYSPAETSAEKTAMIVWIHGGGFALGGLDSEDGNCRMMVRDHGVTVVSVDYRLAPEHPFPAAFDDCYTVLVWAASHADELGADPDRIALAGHSAGAALCVSVALASRDRGGPALRFLYLGYPVLHDDPDTESRRTVNDPRLWRGDQAELMWAGYLADTAPDVPYAVPARAAVVAGLPSTYLTICAEDPHRDEAWDFARRLMRDGVQVEAHLIPGAPHMVDVYAPHSPAVTRAVAAWSDALAHGLARTASTY